MKNTYVLSQDIIIMIIIVAILLCLIGVGIWLSFLGPFMDQRTYIIMEIKRSNSKNEYRYWKKQLKKLYLESIPLIGRFFK